jgi:glycosyltransferase involved in cell wall biosynthesis
MSQSLVSIIIPAFNRALLIPETLDSVYKQEYQSIELIVVNDGSTDDTITIVNDWFDKNGNRFVHTLLHSFDQNKGKSEAVNFGFSLSGGEYVMILDSDDLLTNQAINTEVEFLKNHPTVGAVFAGAYLLNNRKKTDVLIHTTQHFTSFQNVRLTYGDILLKGNCIVASTVLMKKKIVSSIGGFRIDLRYTHDLDYWIRISREYDFGYVNVPILFYRRNFGDGSSLQLQKTFSEILLLLNENIQNYTFYEILRAILIQTKFHFVTSSSAHSFLISFSMIICGLKSISKFVFTGKLI